VSCAATHYNALQHAATHDSYESLVSFRTDCRPCKTLIYRALQCVAVRCSALQRVAACCSVLQCVAVRCSVLQRVAVCCSVLQPSTYSTLLHKNGANLRPAMQNEHKTHSNKSRHMKYHVQCVAVCCSVLQCVAVCCSVSQCVTTHKVSCAVSRTGWQRPIGCLICIDHFPQKSPTISGSVAKSDLQLKASYESSPPCKVSCRVESERKTHLNMGWLRLVGSIKL